MENKTIKKQCIFCKSDTFSQGEIFKFISLEFFLKYLIHYCQEDLVIYNNNSENENFLQNKEKLEKFYDRNNNKYIENNIFKKAKYFCKNCLDLNLTEYSGFDMLIKLLNLKNLKEIKENKDQLKNKDGCLEKNIDTTNNSQISKENIAESQVGNQEQSPRINSTNNLNLNNWNNLNSLNNLNNLTAFQPNIKGKLFNPVPFNINKYPPNTTNSQNANLPTNQVQNNFYYNNNLSGSVISNVNNSGGVKHNTDNFALLNENLKNQQYYNSNLTPQEGPISTNISNINNMNNFNKIDINNTINNVTNQSKPSNQNISNPIDNMNKLNMIKNLQNINSFNMNFNKKITTINELENYFTELKRELYWIQYNTIINKIFTTYFFSKIDNPIKDLHNNNIIKNERVNEIIKLLNAILPKFRETNNEKAEELSKLIVQLNSISDMSNKIINNCYNDYNFLKIKGQNIIVKPEGNSNIVATLKQYISILQNQQNERINIEESNEKNKNEKKEDFDVDAHSIFSEKSESLKIGTIVN